MLFPTLQTLRLTLRPWTLDDTDELHALWIRPEVRRYLWDNESIARERAESTVRDFVATQEKEGTGGWVALDRESGGLVGFAGLIRREPGDPELLYGIAPEWWGRGLATEASRAVLAYAFGPLGCERVTAACDVPNAASARVLTRLGMRLMHRGLLNGLDTYFYEVRREHSGWSHGGARLPAE
jgi:ribosomal-protein-alanine N-acetyltransferase